jgi:hypothetical protein
VEHCCDPRGRSPSDFAKPQNEWASTPRDKVGLNGQVWGHQPGDDNADGSTQCDSASPIPDQLTHCTYGTFGCGATTGHFNPKISIKGVCVHPSVGALQRWMRTFPGCPGHAAAHRNSLLSRPHCSKFGLPYFVPSIPMICNAAATQRAYCTNYLVSAMKRHKSMTGHRNTLENIWSV